LARNKTITSRDNPTIKALRALAVDAREIRRQGRTLLDGPHLVESYIQRVGPPELLIVSETGTVSTEVSQLLSKVPSVEILTVPDTLFRELSGVTSPVGVLAAIHLPETPVGLPQGSCVLLDAIQDAGNVGTIMRTAAAAGIGQLALGPGCAGAWTPRVLRAAQGAHFGLHIREQVNLESITKACGAASVAAVARDGTPLYELDLSGDVAWIFGNEGAGIAPALAALAARKATIPMAQGNESLNVSAAAAICLFEGLRQQLVKRGGHA
jgi:RNA methyltransferase, TrmH family